MNIQDEIWIKCPFCRISFNVIWKISGMSKVYDKPEYCPFCGDKIEYKENEE